MHKLGLAVLGVALAVGILPCSPTKTVAAETNIGTKIDGFKLPDFHGKERELGELSDAKLVVVAFLGTECPLVRLYAPRLAELSERFADRGVKFVGINANRHDTVVEMADFAHSYGIPFPLLKDRTGEVADQFGAARTPEVFLLDGSRVVRYRGRIDDQYAVGVAKEEAGQEYLARAIEELLEGKDVSVPVTEAPGCIIARVPKVEPHGEVTYANQVSRIINKRCVECHRAGELAPFALTSYEEVAGWGETIREVVKDGRMPPWFADEKYGHFVNDSSLSDEEKKLIDEWVANGTPEGDLSQLPDAPTFASGWKIGEPDMIVKMPEPFTVPAEGVVDYQDIRVDPGFTEDVWITAAEGRPGNPSVVHHIVLFAVPKGAKGRTDSESIGQMVAIYAPGMPAWVYPEGTAMCIKKNMDLVFQMHYTPNGREQTDQSSVGLKFTTQDKVKQKIRYGMALNMAFEIPAHANDHEVLSKATFRRDTLLLNLFPHMHYRGKSFKFEAFYPDGTSEVLLDVPNYDFNWQLRYDFVEPKFLPKGTKMICTGHFDNSADNPRNPNPNEKVTFGLQSWEEMMVGYYTTVPAVEDVSQPEEETAN